MRIDLVIGENRCGRTTSEGHFKGRSAPPCRPGDHPRSLVDLLGRFLAVAVMLTAAASVASAQRNLKEIPSPDPEVERSTFVLPEGFEVNLFAADPRIAKPIQMNFDAQGRLWICSSETYPHIEPGAEANDKILLLQDRDGDGVSDETTIFAEGLLIPTAVAPGDGGVYVGASTELLHFRDTNGDGQADERQTVLSGFGTEDTHHIIHTLRWGPAARLYFNQSIYIHSHIETPWGVRRLNAGGIWQFRPETLELNVLARGLINPWGTDFDAYGATFATDGAGGEGINYIVPGAYYATAYGASRILPGLNPGSPKHCGLEIVESEHLPPEWQGSCLTNDFRGHRVCRFVLSEDGSGFRSQEQKEVIKSSHVAFRPVDVKIGPDGAIYIADWYNPIIQHGEVDFRDPRRDHVHGRIWRVTYTGRPLNKVDNLTERTTGELLNNLKSSDRFIRQQSKQVLRERGDVILEELNAWAAALPAGAAADRHRLEALWTYQSLDAVAVDLLTACLESDEHNVRAAAVRIVGDWMERLDEPFAALEKRVVDPHPRVRLEAVRALAISTNPQAAVIAMRALDHDVDEWLDYALWLTARELHPYWEPALLAGELSFDGHISHLTFLLKSAGSTSAVPALVDLLQSGDVDAADLNEVVGVVAEFGTPEHFGVLFDQAMAHPEDVTFQTTILVHLANAARSRQLRPARDLDHIAPLLDTTKPQLWSAVIRCVGDWKIESLRDRLLAEANNAARSHQERMVAIEALGRFADAQAIDHLVKIAQSKAADPIKRTALEQLLLLRPKQAAELTVHYLQQTEEPAQSGPLFEAFLQRKGAADLLAEALHQQAMPKDIAVVGMRIVNSSGQGESRLAAELRTAGKLKQAPVQLSSEEMATLINEIRDTGDPARGEQVFRRADLGCLKCHSIGPSGGQVGSNLLSLGTTAQLDYIVESLLDPNAKVKEGFNTLVVATDQGQVFSGIAVRQSDSELVLRDAEGRDQQVSRDRIELQKQGASLMPAGLTSAITHQELVDLVAFLSSLGRVPEYTIGTEPVIRHWEVLLATQKATFQLQRTSYAAATANHAVFQWQRRYSSVRGSLDVHTLPELRVRNRVASGNRGVSFVRAEFSVSGAGTVTFELNDPTGLQIWVDDQPVDADRLLTLELPPGNHRLTFAIDRAARHRPLMVKPSGGTVAVELPVGK